MRPLFITFEGLDGSGKSSHLRRVAKRLEEAGVPHCATHEPGGTPLGESIRDLFLDPRWGSVDGGVELLLVFASRRHHLREVIEPALSSGKHVLCDRFTDSTVAYQGYGRGVSLDTIAAVDRLATGGRVPDRTLLFDLPPDVAQQRGQSASRRARQPTDGGIDRLDREEVAFYRRVREGYLALAKEQPARFRRVDSSGPPEKTAGNVARVLADLLASQKVQKRAPRKVPSRGLSKR